MAVDGNMSAQHLKMRRPDLDIALTDGEGYVVGDFLYHQHLAVAVEIKQVSLTAVSSDFYNYCFVRKPLAEITKHTMNRNQKIIWMPPGLECAFAVAMAVSSRTPWQTFKRVNGWQIKLLILGVEC